MWAAQRWVVLKIEPHFTLFDPVQIRWKIGKFSGFTHDRTSSVHVFTAPHSLTTVKPTTVKQRLLRPSDIPVPWRNINLLIDWLSGGLDMAITSRLFKIIQGINPKPTCDFLLVDNTNWHHVAQCEMYFGILNCLGVAHRDRENGLEPSNMLKVQEILGTKQLLSLNW